MATSRDYDRYDDDDCETEWAEAFAECAKELMKSTPSRRLTGGYGNIYDCAKGLVSERCGGNPVDHSKSRKAR
jgi:hypothetical protein